MANAVQDYIGKAWTWSMTSDPDASSNLVTIITGNGMMP